MATTALTLLDVISGRGLHGQTDDCVYKCRESRRLLHTRLKFTAIPTHVGDPNTPGHSNKPHSNLGLTWTQPDRIQMDLATITNKCKGIGWVAGLF